MLVKVEHETHFETTEDKSKGRQYGVSDVVEDVIIDATINSVLGGALGWWDAKSANNAFNIIVDRVRQSKKINDAYVKQAAKTISKANDFDFTNSIDDVTEIVTLLAAKERGIKGLDQLDPELVQLGDGLRSLILNSEVDKDIKSSLSLDVIKGITAASLDLRKSLAKSLKETPNKRITTIVSEGIRDGSITTDSIKNIKDKYGLSTEQFSYIFMSDLSRAGKVIRTGSTIKEALKDLDMLK